MATSNKVSVSDMKNAASSVKATAAESVKKVTEELKKDATAVKATAKTATKKTAAKKTTATKKVEVKTAVVQYQGLEFTYDECLKKAEAGFKKDNKGKTLEEISIYIKPEERRIYYVANKDCIGSVEL